MEDYYKGLIDMALKDVKASYLLYQKRLYPQSFFFFQQASEKANKAYALFIELISEKELKDKIQHNQLKIFRMATIKEESLVREKVDIMNLRPDIKNHPFLKDKSIDEYHEYIKKGKEFHDQVNEKNLLNLSKYDLEYLLDGLEELYYFKLRRSEQQKQRVIGELHSFIEFRKFAFVPDEETESLIKLLQTEDHSKVYDQAVQSVKFLIKFQFMVCTFYFCALTTQAHAVRARYPEEQFNPITFYTRKNALVEYQPEFLYYLEKALLFFKKSLRSAR
ncbi:MAG: hypothetical protein IPP32_08705 [Bacteroidetes bacterium]|nr:hypothetical protein [Bacteroidota bacterium]